MRLAEELVLLLLNEGSGYLEQTGPIAIVAAVVLVAGAVRARAARGRRYDLVLHRLLHCGQDGAWTWHVRGATVPASRATDVCLPVDPDAEASYCPDCLHGEVRWDAPVVRPRALVCRGCGSQFGLSLVDRKSAARSPQELTVIAW